MKLVATSVVKNDGDIIEAYVRHTRAWTDHHLIFDHDSTDGTREILGALVREGLPLTLFSGESAENLQQARSNALTKLAFAEHAADWVLPLDADEILVMPGGRAALERALASCPDDRPANIPLRNYVPTSDDDPSELNPVARLQYAQRRTSTTMKVFVPRALGVDPNITTGMGNHAVFRAGARMDATPLTGALLAHYALRSPAQQALRILSGELQKISRGKASAGLAMHYRLGFQLLAENPEQFFATIVQPPEAHAHDPAPYLGDSLRYTAAAHEWSRAIRAVVPLLEQLALSHGSLVDQLGAAAPTDASAPCEVIRPLITDEIRPPALASAAAFSGFAAIAGWEPQEGPVPEAFLPPFHWATGPETHFTITADSAGVAQLEAEALTYANDQETTILLNGTEIHRRRFPRVNQKENLSLTLRLRAGENHLLFRHSAWLETAADPRKLALIFLGLRVRRQ